MPMKYIPLHISVTRGRPEPPLSQLHNDCGAQDRCARRLAANTNCLPTKDFSKLATPYGVSMQCGKYVPIATAEHATESHEAKTMQEPE